MPADDSRLRPEVFAETASSAVAISRVFFDDGDISTADERDVRIVDDLLSDALLAAEGFERLPVVAPDVRPDSVKELVVGVMRECLETVVAVRYRQVSREQCRQRALITHDHVIRTFGSNAATAPMLQALAALHVLPDGPDRFVLANSLEPDPDVPFETVIAAALVGVDEEMALLETVATSHFVMPVLGASLDENALELQFLPVTTEHGPAVAAWTAEARFDEYRQVVQSTDGIYPMVIDGSELRDLCPPGHGVIINPGSLLCLTLTADQVRRLPVIPAASSPGGDASGPALPAPNGGASSEHRAR